jgi:type IV secretion system protein VirB10
MTPEGHDEEAYDDYVEPVPFWRRRKMLIIAGVSAVALLFIFTRGKTPVMKDEAMKNDAFIGVVVPYQPAAADAPPPAPPPAKTEVHPAPPPPVVAQAPPQAAPAPPPVRDFMPRMPLPPGVQPKPPRPVMLSYLVPHADGPKPAPAPPAEPPQTGLAFKTATLPGTKASGAIDDTYELMPGLLPCVLDTAIQSDLPGPLLCHLPGPVYSPKGVLLMEAETQVIGRYETLGKTGSNRLMAVSTFAHTPHGIWVPLTGEPFADDLGRSGLDGAVDQHFMQRFGAAIVMTLTEGALGIVQADVSKGGNTYLQLNSGGGVGGLAQQILQAQVNIPPTFSKHQGETIALFLDQPIDFSDSYRIRQVRQ